jgi:hypothetical protein
MSLPAPAFQMAHAVLGIDPVVMGDPARDERFIAAVKTEFPNLVTRQHLPAEMPPGAPRLLLASTSSQLAVSASQIDFEVRFYGDYLGDSARGIDYVDNKLQTVLQGLEAADLNAVTVGLIGTFRFPFPSEAEGDSPALHILETLLKADVDREHVQDAMAKVAIRISDTYFVNLAVSNYEARIVERPIMPGVPVAVRPWEGRPSESGIELAVDVNNLLEVRRAAGVLPTVTADSIRAVARLFRDVAMRSGPAFVEGGVVPVDDLVAML